MFSLEGKKALITGACGGIGSVMAKIFHDSGATVLLTGTNKEKLEEIKSELGKDRVYAFTADLSKASEAKEVIDKAIKQLGKLDILICNAGVTRDTLSIRMTDEDFDFVMNINLKAAFILNREAVKHMIRNKTGRIVNIASVVAFIGNPGQANYCASKAGIIGMSKAIAKEVASRGVTVNCIAPGFIETAMTAKLPEEQKDQLKAFIPSKKLGTPLDVACAALYLASDEASYVTGSTLHVNGGMFMN